MGLIEEPLFLQTLQSTLTLKGESGVQTAAFSKDGKVLATGCHDDMIWLWDVQTGQLIK